MNISIIGFVSITLPDKEGWSLEPKAAGKTVGNYFTPKLQQSFAICTQPLPKSLRKLRLTMQTVLKVTS